MKDKTDSIEMRDITTLTFINGAVVQRYCTANNLYTCGTQTDFDGLISYADSQSPLSDDRFTVVYAIASDIFNHSDVEYFCGHYSCTEKEFLEHLLNGVERLIHTTYIINEKESEV